ncbi:MAG: ATP-binding cassette domain-containing protein [Sphingomonadaceae bacterium]|jgi:ATP-binding cassette subfamily C protein
MKLPITSEEAQRAVREMRPAAWGIAAISFMIALFPVAASIYVLLLFEVAIPGRSLSTLVGVSLLMLALVGVHGYLRFLRRKMLGHVQGIIVTHVLPRLDEVSARVSEDSTLGQGDGDQAVRDLDAISVFLKAPVAAAWVDVAAVPILLFVMLFLHGWLALSLLLFAGGMSFMLWRTVNMLEQPLRDVVPLLARRQAVSILGRSHIDIIRGLGMKGHARQVWMLINASLNRAMERAGAMLLQKASIARALLFTATGMALAIGAALTITDSASPAVTFAAAVLTWLALEPLVTCINQAQQFVAARQGWARIDALLRAVMPPVSPVRLPPPTRKLDCEGIAVMPAGLRKPVVRNIQFSLQAGDVMAIVGPSACGKSTILRAIAGIVPLAQGKIRLDDAALDQWGEDALGPHIGYMPQSIQLIEGSVADNIGRFDPEADPKMVVAAGQAAHAHEMIVKLPEGYNTLVGPNGSHLSLSQAQRIAFSRSLYSDPLVLALDEPTAHVDMAGEQMFTQSIEAARKRGAIVILAGNANALVQVASHVLVMRDGTMLDFGLKEEVRQRMAERRKRIKPEQGSATRPAHAESEEQEPQPVSEPEPSS